MDIIFKLKQDWKFVAEEIKCPKCENKMINLQACHMFCPKCGSHLDCSDKGSYW